MAKVSKLTSEETQLLTERGERLALLLAAADIPDELKVAWVEALPHMSFDDLNEFIALLEEHAAQRADTHQLEQQFKSIITKHQQQTAELDQQLAQQLGEIQEELTEQP